MGFKTRSCLSPKKVGWTGDGRKERGRPLTTSSPLLHMAAASVCATDRSSKLGNAVSSVSWVPEAVCRPTCLPPDICFNLDHLVAQEG